MFFKFKFSSLRRYHRIKVDPSISLKKLTKIEDLNFLTKCLEDHKTRKEGIKKFSKEKMLVLTLSLAEENWQFFCPKFLNRLSST